jgi:N-methylhydantoinase B
LSKQEFKGRSQEFDSLTRGILWDRLVSIADEVYQSFIKSSFSTLVRDSYDAVFVIFDEKGRLLAQASFGPPSFIGTSTNTINELLRRFPKETFKPGDIVGTNDPWIGTGQINDLSMIRPMFEEDALIGFTSTVQHLPDIGGAHTMSGIASDIYEEGIRIPPSIIAKQGVPDKDLFEIISSNVRIPGQVFGDISAGMTANALGERLTKSLVKEYNLNLLAFSESIISLSQDIMKQSIGRFPKGVYTKKIFTEGYLQSESIQIACTVSVKDEEIIVDFDGTSPCVAKGLNVPFVYTSSFSRYAIKCVFSPQLPNNEGSMSPVKIVAPEDCILNAPPPHSTSARHITGWFVPMAVWGALAEVAPDRVIAESGTPSMLTFSGKSLDGSHFILPIGPSIIGGSGARSHEDGDIMAMPTNIARVPVEVWEKDAGGSLLVESCNIVEDSAGAGKFRGGPSVESIIVNLSKNHIAVATTGGRTRFAAKGYFGGHEGRCHEVYINERKIMDKGIYELGPGERLRFITPAGGGMFDPKDRERERVKDDLKNGLISEKTATKIYGYRS